MKKAIFLLAVLVISNQLKADSNNELEEIFAVHPKIGIGAAFHTSDFNYLNQQLNCGLFSNGFGMSLSPGINIEFPLMQNLYADFGLQYLSISGNFELDRLAYGYDIANQKAVPITATNKIDANLAYFMLEPGIKYQLSDNFISGPLFLNASLGFGLPISNTFTQTEDIKSPQNSYFINDSKYVQSRELFDGDISNVTGLLVNLTLGAENQMTIGKNLAFTQAIALKYNLNSFVSHSSWNSLDVNFALGIRYSFRESEKAIIATPAPPAIIETKPIENPKPVLAINFANPNYDKFVVKTGNELVATQTLLNTIFFPNSSSSIPDDYAIEPDKTINYNKLDPISAHKYCLVRIAELVNKNDKATLTINGSTSGTQSEPSGLLLAKQRAESVAQALMNLGVNKNKIQTKWDITPANPTNQEYKEGVDENQRVDISLKNAVLQEYVFEQEYAEVKGAIEIGISMKNFESTAPAKVKLNIPDTTLLAYKSDMYSVPISQRINESDKLLNVVAEIEKDGIILKNNLEINLSNLRKEIVELKTNNFKAIIRFDYNSNTLSYENKELIRELMQVLPPNSTIRILGSADQLGTEASNRRLENERAFNTEEFVRSINKEINIKTGINTEKFNAQTPIGRFLNRSIIISIE